MLQAGLFDILSFIGVGTWPRVMRCAHDGVVWTLACSRRWAARNLTRGLRPPPACDGLKHERRVRRHILLTTELVPRASFVPWI